LNFRRVAKAFLLQLNARKAEILPWAWSTTVGAMIAGHGFPPVSKIFLTVFSMLAFAVSGYTYNDITDMRADSLNSLKKKRPIPSGKITVEEAKIIVLTTGLLGVSLAAFTAPTVFLLIMIWTTLLFSYSNPGIKLKKRFLLKEGTIAIGFFLSVLIGAISVGSIPPAVIFGGIFWGVFAFLGSPAFRDTTDLEEDKLYGVRSLAVVLDWKTKIEMVILFILAAMTLTPLTYVYLNLNVIFPIVVVALCFLVLRFLFPLLRQFDEKNYKRAYNSLYGFLIASQISMILGAMPLAAFINI